MGGFTTKSSTKARDYHLTVLGRTLEHLGVQMYKRRDVAIAELVANCWDAGATTVRISVPEPAAYDPGTSIITITDNGSGMTEDGIQDSYLVVGRNRREVGDLGLPDRPVMGRKGVGKLAGFGLASRMTMVTWRDGQSIELTLDVLKLKTEDNSASNVTIPATIGKTPEQTESPAGTRITLAGLKHKSSMDIGKLIEALARRFTRHIRGQMTITVNGQQVNDPGLVFEQCVPQDMDTYENAALPDGSQVKYHYGFTKSVIQSTQMRGFTIYVRGKTAQAPPFFFDVEGTAPGQHDTKYLTGEIEADFLDDGNDDESDLISTDRQEIDWESERAHQLLEWGAGLTRRALRDRSSLRGKMMVGWVLDDPDLNKRIRRLDTESQKQIKKYLGVLGEAEAERDRALELANALVRAYEYQQFSDVIRNVEDASSDPEQLHILLEKLVEWKVIESRAILEIIKGRLGILDKFHSMIVNNAPETASSVDTNNMHDLIAGYPWLLNPEWQVLSEEKTISKQLSEWDRANMATDSDKQLRYDFLALGDDKRLVVIEIKRSGHAVTLDELQRLETYMERLTKGAGRNVSMLLVHGGTVDVSPQVLKTWETREDAELRTWGVIYSKTRAYYEHYRAILEGDVGSISFAAKQQEVAATRTVLQQNNVHRGVEKRVGGIGPQDVRYDL